MKKHVTKSLLNPYIASHLSKELFNKEKRESSNALRSVQKVTTPYLH